MSNRYKYLILGLLAGVLIVTLGACSHNADQRDSDNSNDSSGDTAQEDENEDNPRENKMKTHDIHSLKAFMDDLASDAAFSESGGKNSNGYYNMLDFSYDRAEDIAHMDMYIEYNGDPQPDEIEEDARKMVLYSMYHQVDGKVPSIQMDIRIDIGEDDVKLAEAGTMPTTQDLSTVDYEEVNMSRIQ